MTSRFFGTLFTLFSICWLASQAAGWARADEPGTPEWWLRTSESHFNLSFIGSDPFGSQPDRKPDIDRFSRLTATGEFENAVAALRASCGETRVMRLDEKFSIAYGDLYLDIRRPNEEILGFLGQCAETCARFNVLLGDARARLAAGDVLEDPRALLTAKAAPVSLYTAVQGWADALKGNDFSTLVSEYKQGCHASQVVLELGAENAIEPSESSPHRLRFNVRKPVKPQLAGLKAFSGRCRDYLDGMTSLNLGLAMPRGLYFRFAPSELSSKRAAIPNLVRWIKFFAADPRRLDALNGAIDRAAFAPALKRYCVVRRVDFTETVEELDDADCATAQGTPRLLIVEFGPIWGSYQPQTFLERMRHNDITTPIPLIFEDDAPHVPHVIPGS